MKITSVIPIEGPNIYNDTPILMITLDLEEMGDVHSLMVPGFNDRLLATLPDLEEHHCSPGHRGGFIERLQRGTYFAHILEHIILELSKPAGIPVTYGKSIYGGKDFIYKIVVGSKSAEGMTEIAYVALELLQAVIEGKSYSLEENLEVIRRIIARTSLGPSSKVLIRAAEKRGIPWTRLNTDSLIQLGYGKNRKLIETALSSETSAIAVSIAKDKESTKQILNQALIPVPFGHRVHQLEDAFEAFEMLTPPLVVKPFDGNQGKGVTLNVTTREELSEAFAFAASFSKEVLIEEFFKGKDYRVLVVGGKLIAASERVPAHVIGDGVHNLSQLIELENQNPLRGNGHEKPLTKIHLDTALLSYLRRRGLALESVPASGEKIDLAQTANLSTGGFANDVTSAVHPEVKAMCERAARLIGLDICGIDLILNDIAKPVSKEANGIIEVNASPGLRMHHYPMQGEPQDVGGAIVDMLYPAPSSSRIPIVSITGTNGKTTVTRMISHIFASKGLSVGMATTDGIQIGGRRIAEGDMTGPASAKIILSDPLTEVAVLETARGGIVRRGLGYDWSDVGVLTNIQADHIGQDGIENIDDIIHIKSVVAERVRKDGILIVNADDENIAKLMEKPRLAKIPRRLVYFSLHSNHVNIKRHVDKGGIAYVVQDGQIVEVSPDGRSAIMPLSDISVTFGGRADFQVANALAATAACRASGCTAKEVAEGLKSFSSLSDNPGRLNVFQVGKGYVVLDYGHNPKAFQSMSSMLRRWEGRKISAVVGVPGDRSDDILRQSAEIIAKGFDKLILREDEDLRGRASGDVTRLLLETIRKTAPQIDCKIILESDKALRSALREMEEGEIVAVFYEHRKALQSLLEEQGAIAVSQIEPFKVSQHVQEDVKGMHLKDAM